MHMCECMCVCIYVCACIYVYAYRNAYMDVSMYIKYIDFVSLSLLSFYYVEDSSRTEDTSITHMHSPCTHPVNSRMTVTINSSLI